MDEPAARNWLELPPDMAREIFRRLGVRNVLMCVQQVCTTWRGICMDASMWRHVEMLTPIPDWKSSAIYVNRVLCRLVVDLSLGSLTRIGISHFADDSLLLYIAERSSQLKHLKLVCCSKISKKALASVAAKVPLLEELELSDCLPVTANVVEAFGRFCPLLKSFTLLGNGFGSDDMARAIGDNMPGLVHLQFIGLLTVSGLEAILDGCQGLESLDLRWCCKLSVGGELRKTCAERIKDLRLPYDPTYDKRNKESSDWNEDDYYIYGLTDSESDHV